MSPFLFRSSAGVRIPSPLVSSEAPAWLLVIVVLVIRTTPSEVPLASQRTPLPPAAPVPLPLISVFAVPDVIRMSERPPLVVIRTPSRPLLEMLVVPRLLAAA